MSIEAVKEYLKEKGFADRVIEFDDSSATVSLASSLLGVEDARIAKTMSFSCSDRIVIIVLAGDKKVNSGMFKRIFGSKPSMLGLDEVERLTGHPVGGVCPFLIPSSIDVFLDSSLKEFDTVYPAAGNAKSAVRLTPFELYELSGAKGWVDVVKKD